MSEIPAIIIPQSVPLAAQLPGYPVAGVGVVSGNQSPTKATSLAALRVNSFSATALPDNTALIAVASQDPTVVSELPINETDSFAEVELARRESSRVFVHGSLLDPSGMVPTTVRTGRVESSNSLEETITIEVDDVIYGQTTYQALWCLDGELAGKRFQVERRVSPNLFVCKHYGSPYAPLATGLTFGYVSYRSATSIAPVAAFTPLPYIEHNGFAIPAVNPQIATNAAIFPPPANPYVYVVCQAPVNGTYQLFFYGFQLGTTNIYLWKQLTFNGENKNPRCRVDSIGNLHIVWESNRCGTKNVQGVYYGVLGASSRGLFNESFVSALDKHAMAVASGKTIDQLLTYSSPVALDLRDINEYGTHTGAMWDTHIENGGSVTVTDAGTISVSGNPSSQAFTATARLRRDQNDAPLDGKFSQMSYQVSFKFTLTTGNAVLSDDDIRTAYAAFKGQFAPTRTSASGVNIYTKNGKQYTISRYTKLDGGLIPVVGSYELNGLPPAAGAKLKHFMLGVVPEKVSFEATNINNENDTVSSVLYTGKYKLSLVLRTSANLSDRASGEQSFHAVRDVGLFSVGTQYDVKIATHYAKLHAEQVAERLNLETVNGTAQSVRFSGNVIVAVDNTVRVADNFEPVFDDAFYGFDIALGAIPGGQFPLNYTLPYNQSLFENQSVTMAYSSIAIGPHTMLADQFLVNAAKFDRNASRMVIKNTKDESASGTAFDEAFLTEPQYDLSLGLYQNKITLSQTPIAFLGKSTLPSLWVDSCDNVHVAYQSDREVAWQIYYTGSVDAGMPFRFDTKISDSKGSAICPTVAADQRGRRLVAWQDDRTGVFQIYAARSNRIFDCNFAEVIEETLELGDGINTPDEYDPYDPYGADICNVLFTYTNDTGIGQYFNFSLDFYSDSLMSHRKTTVNSLRDKTNWRVNGSQMDSAGIHLNPGESATVAYYPARGDDLSGVLYYVRVGIETFGSSSPWPYVYAYYCPVEQSAECTIPCVYTNSGTSPQNVHFRVSFYSDQAHAHFVLSADSSSDQRGWVASPANTLPAGGVSVPGHDTASVYYIPNVLPPELYSQQNRASPDALLCGATYYVKVESKVSSVYSQIDSFAFECKCSWVQSKMWRKDSDSGTWVCSGQGMDDARITNTLSPAMFPSAAASSDGIVYVSWEDYREKESDKDLSPDVFFSVWDARKDVFYGSAQGSYDQRVTPYSGTGAKKRFYKPLSLVGNFQNPTFFFNDRTDVYASNCTLFRSVTQVGPKDDYPIGAGVFTDDFASALTLADVQNCIDIRVLPDDVAGTYHADSDTPISLIKHCFVRLDLRGPTGTYAVRLRNENEPKWSDWLSILPELPEFPPRNTYNLRGDGTLRDRFEAYFVGDERFVVPWVLSPGSGNKTVYAQILTRMGQTPEFSLNVIARYDELKYKVEFFTTNDFSVPTPTFGGYPVVSTKMLEPADTQEGDPSPPNHVTESDVSSITRNTQPVDTIYVRVTFSDVDALEKLLSLASVQKFSTLFAPGAAPNLSFNVLGQGVNAFYGLPLVGSNGVYTGSFPIEASDGVYNKDGLACVVVNVPNPATKLFTPQLPYESLDAFNVNPASLGDFEGAYSVVPQETPEDVKSRQRAGLAARAVTVEQFHQKYDKTLMCSFRSADCVSGAPVADAFDDEVTAPPAHTGPLICQLFNWTAYEGKEPNYYLDGSNLSTWVRYSPPLYMNMTDDRSLSLSFGQGTDCSGVLFMIKPGESITNTGGTNPGDPVTFTVPLNSIVLANNSGFFCGDATPLRRASVAKTFTSGAASASIPAGTIANNGTVGASSVFSVGWDVRTFTAGIPKSVLQSKGFLTSNGVLTAKFALITSGTAHCYIRNASCDANCN
jgi:hypothetical protein